MADQILSHIRTIGKGSATVADYENGREEGYVLTCDKTGRSATFSEYRNSDDAVVYLVDWNRSTDADRDAAYNSKTFFDYNNALGAAKFIVAFFNGK